MSAAIGSFSLFSAHAEVFPGAPAKAAAGPALLRARGGISWGTSRTGRTGRSSPRTRRYFQGSSPWWLPSWLFSAHAEVFPTPVAPCDHPDSLLRARGGISPRVSASTAPAPSSPRTRRYFPHRHRGGAAAALFSAHAEVFPIRPGWSFDDLTLLRARGGISIATSLRSGKAASSPRTRRYFLAGRIAKGVRILFSAHAEVFPLATMGECEARALLRARGGISTMSPKAVDSFGSSPRTRRYFRSQQWSARCTPLFSAHAEVFPGWWTMGWCRMTLLRARGGISTTRGFFGSGDNSSPRTRRYFRGQDIATSLRSLFSAHAEVFPRHS